MDLTYVIVGEMKREYVLPPVGPPLLDSPGGSALYACGGLLTWAGEVGLVARVSEDYPPEWLRALERNEIDVRGIRTFSGHLDVRAFAAYSSDFHLIRGAPVSQFARRGLPFPKSLLGYQPPPESIEDRRRPEPMAPTPEDLPIPYLDARAAHLCPLDFFSHHRMLTALKAGGVATVTVDPSPGYMNPAFLADLRGFLASTTAFLPSEAELRALFWGHTHDLWEMMSAIGSYGCEIVVVKRGSGGQAVFDPKGNHRWEIPAYPARPADPTGVGDAFCGGFLAGYKACYDPLEATLYGNVSASLKIEGSGAFYQLGVLKGLAVARLLVLHDMVREV